MRGNVQENMLDGIEKTVCVIVFITERYIQKATGRGPRKKLDNCFIEFEHATQVKGRSWMLPVVMEPRCRNLNSWVGKMSFLSGQLYLDGTSDDNFEATMDQLCDEIRNRIKLPWLERWQNISSSPTIAPNPVVPPATSPLVSAARASVQTTSGDHLAKEMEDWFINLKITPNNAQQYSHLLLDKGIGSIDKLSRKLNRDKNLLQQLEIDEDDADDILDALFPRRVVAESMEDQRLLNEESENQQRLQAKKEEEEAEKERKRIEETEKESKRVVEEAAKESKPLKVQSQKLRRTDNDIETAVKEWCADPQAAKDKYGDISEWNTSAVTTMNLECVKCHYYAMYV